ncbi:membrane protein [Planctomycetota bacterium]|nr:membrane protein [Planctomycetota bacterium]
MMDWIYDSQAWIALVTLTFLEIILGIDNIVFVSILTSRLPQSMHGTSRRVGLLMAMGMRIGLLFSINWVMSLTTELFRVVGHGFSGRDLILLGGGLFLMWKSTTEIHHKLEGDEADEVDPNRKPATFAKVITQIAILDIVFSLDSVITAVGMAKDLAVMVIAVLISVGFMMIFVNPICTFVEKHPTVKLLALSFLLLIGFTLVAEAFHQEIPKGYVYFAMAFSVGVEALNLRLRKPGKPVNLNGPEKLQ